MLVIIGTGVFWILELEVLELIDLIFWALNFLITFIIFVEFEISGLKCL